MHSYPLIIVASEASPVCSHFNEDVVCHGSFDQHDFLHMLHTRNCTIAHVGARLKTRILKIANAS